MSPWEQKALIGSDSFVSLCSRCASLSSAWSDPLKHEPTKINLIVHFKYDWSLQGRARGPGAKRITLSRDSDQYVNRLIYLKPISSEEGQCVCRPSPAEREREWVRDILMGQLKKDWRPKHKALRITHTYTHLTHPSLSLFKRQNESKITQGHD